MWTIRPCCQEVTEAVKVVHQAGISVKMMAGVGVKCGILWGRVILLLEGQQGGERDAPDDHIAVARAFMCFYSPTAPRLAQATIS